MVRPLRISTGGVVYHVLNRANAKRQIFFSDTDYDLFESTLFEAQSRFGMPILVYESMPNHIHLSLYPQQDELMPKFMHWLTTTFTDRYHIKHETTGTGHIFQGRYKSKIVDTDRYLMQLFMYIERNALKKGLVKRAEDWRWSSLWIREFGTSEQKKHFSEWPIERPGNYLELINADVEIDRDELGLAKKPLGRPKNKRGSEKRV